VDARRAQQLLTAGTWVAAAAGAVFADRSWPTSTVGVIALVLVAPAAALGGQLDVDIDLGTGRRGWPFRTVDALLGMGLVLAPTLWWLALLVAGCAVGMLPGRLPRTAVARAGGKLALSGSVALLVLALESALGVPGPVAVPVMLLAAALSSHLVTAVGVAWTLHRPLRATVRGGGLLLPLESAVTGMLGALVGILLWLSPAAGPLLVVLVVLLLLTRSAQRRHEADLQMFAELVRGQEQAAGRSVDVSAEVVLGAAARLLGGADCELLVRHPAGPVRFAGDEYGVRERVPVAGGEFDQTWALEVLGAPTARTGSDRGRPYVAAAIGRVTPWALLIARRTQGAPAFGRTDRRRLRALTEQAQTWLAVSELTGGADYVSGLPAGLTSTAEPALRTLRDASRRLSGLAQRWDSADPVSDVVTEMHACEHAVTELMGAVLGRQVPPSRASHRLIRPVEWTSTGVFTDETQSVAPGRGGPEWAPELVSDGATVGRDSR